MAPSSRIDRTVLGARIQDLQSEFEAQLRTLAKLEEALIKSRHSRDAQGERVLESVLARTVSDMLCNNEEIRTVLENVASESKSSALS